MHAVFRRTLTAATLATTLALSPLALTHFDDKEVLQSYRQSWFAMLAVNTGPMFSMIKGEMPWNEQLLQDASEQFVQLTQMDMSRGFAPGSEKGTTRAKPEIWDNQADFEAKMSDLADSAIALQTAVAGGDRKVITKAIADTGGTCKACHDEYKSENYLY